MISQPVKFVDVELLNSGVYIGLTKTPHLGEKENLYNVPLKENFAVFKMVMHQN